MTQQSSSKLIIVSNRLPITLCDIEGDNIQFKKSAGGLVTAINGFMSQSETSSLPFDPKNIFWVGCLGESRTLHTAEKTMLEQKLMHEHKYVPVFVKEKSDYDNYYNGYSNCILWPVVLYQNYSPINLILYEKYWKAYQVVNQTFADTIASIYNDGDMIWIQDYHLMILATYLRQNPKTKNAKLGFFLHTSFPIYEIMRTLPDHKTILQGILDCSVIGFHCYPYLRDFVNCCERAGLTNPVESARLLSCSSSPEDCRLSTFSSYKPGNARNKLLSLPIGINPSEFWDCASSESVKRRVENLRQSYKGKKIVLGVDRLDQTKGLELKLRAFEKFLCRYPDQADKVVLVQLAVPTRTAIPEYQAYHKTIHELAGSINSKFGGSKLEFPVHLIYQEVNREELCSLYGMADCLVVSSLRDGMNLVALEYVVCQQALGQHGALMLSEFTGCAYYLSGAVLMNPWDTDKTAESIHHCLYAMPEKEKKSRQKLNFKFSVRNTCFSWAQDFLEHLCRLDVSSKLSPKPSIQPAPLQQEKGSYIIIVDEASSVKPQMIEFLNTMSSQEVPTYILSSKHKGDLAMQQICKHVGFIAEDGALCKHPDAPCWVHLAPNAQKIEWLETARHTVNHFADRIPHTTLSIKDTSISLSFKPSRILSQFSQWQIEECKYYTQQLKLKNMELCETTESSFELKPLGISKSRILQELLNHWRPYFTKNKIQNVHFVLFNFFSAQNSSQDRKEVEKLAMNASPTVKLFDVQEEQTEPWCTRGRIVQAQMSSSDFIQFVSRCILESSPSHKQHMASFA